MYDIGCLVPLHGAKGMMISLRLDGAVVAEVDRVAFASGMSRSAWLSGAIARGLLAINREALPSPAADQERGEEGKGSSIQLRLSSLEIAVIAKVAAEHELSRMEWIRRLIRWQLWDKAGELRLGRGLSNEVENLVRQVRAIGTHLNQAVQAMNVANQSDGRPDIVSAAADVVAMEQGMRRELNLIMRQLQRIVSGSVQYWTEQRPDLLKQLGLAEPDRLNTGDGMESVR